MAPATSPALAAIAAASAASAAASASTASAASAASTTAAAATAAHAATTAVPAAQLLTSTHPFDPSLLCGCFAKSGSCAVTSCPYAHTRPTEERPVPSDVCRFFAAGQCLRLRCDFLHGTESQLQELRDGGAAVYRPAALMRAVDPLAPLPDDLRQAHERRVASRQQSSAQCRSQRRTQRREQTQPDGVAKAPVRPAVIALALPPPPLPPPPPPPAAPLLVPAPMQPMCVPPNGLPGSVLQPRTVALQPIGVPPLYGGMPPVVAAPVMGAGRILPTPLLPSAAPVMMPVGPGLLQPPPGLVPVVPTVLAAGHFGLRTA